MARHLNLRGLNSGPSTRAMNAVDLASLLCSRLCHDLMSPVGALNNGIELLADETDPEMREKCLELLADSARASANKLKFFRLAFGAAAVSARRSTRTRLRRARRRVRAGAADRTRLGGRATTSCPRAPSSCCSTSRCLPATRWCAAGGSTSARSARRRDRACDPRRGAADPARPGASRDAGERRSGGTVEPRAAGAWLAHSLAAEAGGAIQLSDAVERGAADRRGDLRLR